MRRILVDKKTILFIIFILFFLIILSINNIEAKQGCCSHHGGVCGCSCCDGTSLSATCAPYYPQCNKPVKQSISSAGQEQTISIQQDGKLSFLRDDDSIIISIDIEITETPESRRIGLMNRELPDFSNGMLFVYQDVEPRNFWMHNTPTSLDIIFVGEDSCVVNIAPKTTPMSDQIYSSKVPVKYVVEVKAGFTEQCGIKEGIKISWGKL